MTNFMTGFINIVFVLFVVFILFWHLVLIVAMMKADNVELKEQTIALLIVLANGYVWVEKLIQFLK